MGKNHRHKKNLKADKAKVKLKQAKTKFLPKGQNVTDTTFKIKPIVLQEQLKEKIADVPLSRRKLDIKDLLSRIKHYNENVRHKACEELTEMIKWYSEEIINHHLSAVILAVSALMQDKERKVRRAAIKVTNAILEVVPDEKLDPFYNYFLVNLRCAMTNINKNVQEDSLMFLDSFLLHNSKMISKSPEKLLPDFFTLISKLRSESNLDRTLTVNLGSKMTSVMWRIKVLSRLHAVLEKILGIDKENNSMSDQNELVFNVDDSTYFPLYKTNIFKCLNNSISNYSINQSTNSSVDCLENNIVTVVPLLYETWMEVMPEKKLSSSNQNTLLTEESAAVLSCVMNTLYLLWKYVSKKNDESIVKSVFLSKEGNKFFDYLVANFPYKQPESRNKKGKGSNELKLLETNNDSKCLRENLLVCFIYSALNVELYRQTKHNNMQNVVGYIFDLLSRKTVLDQRNGKILMEFLKMSLLNESQTWRKCGVDLRHILDGTIQFYNEAKISENLKLDLFKLLADLADSMLVQKSSQYSSWLESLPHVLNEEKISDLQINCLLNMSKRGNIIFHESLNRKLPKILENLDNIRVVIGKPSLLNNECIIKRNLVNIFFYLPRIGKIKGRVILEFISAHPKSEFALHFRKMLELKKELRY